MHNETTLFYYIEKLHRLCFQLFSHFQNINETYFSFVKLFSFFVWKWDDFNETTIQGNFLKTKQQRWVLKLAPNHREHILIMHIIHFYVQNGAFQKHLVTGYYNTTCTLAYKLVWSS